MKAPIRKCTSCGVEYSAKRKSIYKCPPCQAEYGRSYYLRNKEILSQKAKIRYQNDIVRRQRLQREKASGVTDERRFEMLESQGGVCAICQTSAPGGQGIWHVDHNHRCCESLPTCGECLRGVLCHKCNTGLGLFQDSTTVLRAAMDYLLQTQKTPQS